MHPHGAPKPDPDLWNEMVQAAAASDDYRFAIARSRYLARLHDAGIEDHAHGSEAPPDAFDD